MVNVKHEARFLYVYMCDSGFWVAAIFRGPSRIEAIFVDKSLNTLVQHIKRSSLFKELRAAWPSKVAEEMYVGVISPEEYLSDCTSCIYSLLENLCHEIVLHERFEDNDNIEYE
ncbi:hypothetical protein Pdsh_09150 [Pyrodictium delaneyi]|uniref:Uncharacterized protein n=1 Tax=Pyrodictium delaneyi TaxID=1273541 RepID=A0A211YM39_9CREN|nr:hypothetical protein Pdsh_09150 [Pyrodictium delaneyi]